MSLPNCKPVVPQLPNQPNNLNHSEVNKQRANSLLTKMLYELSKLENDAAAREVAYVKRGDNVYGK